MGIVEKGLEEMQNRFGTSPEDLHVHLGPAICGDCYEVGPEVFKALDLPVPGEPRPLDLRGIIATRAVRGGVCEGRLSVSSFCTLCRKSPFYSHRGGDEGRQVAFLGIRK
jgi:copper oxidase (laccase) domain-containing protein